MSALIALLCPECGDSFDPDQLQTICRACESPLQAQYDLAQVRAHLTKEMLRSRTANLWRWAELLPVRDPDHRLTLGEGGTALVEAPHFAQRLGIRNLTIKDESVNPSGSFKARGFAAAVSRAIELGAERFVLPTAGNAGGALAIYCAFSDTSATIFMPSDAHQLYQHEVQLAGADLYLVDGLIHDAGAKAGEYAELNDCFNLSTFKEPYRLEGKKTLGFELLEQLDWHFPDVIVYPTGGGTGLVGMWKAFHELLELGWVEGDLPRMVSVQAEGCAPVVRAVETDAERIEPWEGATTAAQGLRVPSVFADRLVLGAIRESNGTGIAVSEEEIRNARRDLASETGILACLEGAATLAGLRRLKEMSWLHSDDRVVLFNTGSGLKDLA